jgi:hypothetical protein
MTVEAIKQAIASLSEQERASLAAWMIEQDYDEWDMQMARDFSRGGRGRHVVDKVNRDINEGKFSPLKKP